MGSPSFFFFLQKAAFWKLGSFLVFETGDCMLHGRYGFRGAKWPSQKVRFMHLTQSKILIAHQIQVKPEQQHRNLVDFVQVSHSNRDGSHEDGFQVILLNEWDNGQAIWGAGLCLRVGVCMYRAWKDRHCTWPREGRAVQRHKRC
jgi:hypothetical protein